MADDQPQANGASRNPLISEQDQPPREKLVALERELQESRENLEKTIQELADSNEQLQVSNEELFATNEELYTVNEELQTVNAEYQVKIAELTELTHDMDNMLNSSDVHMLFLDEDLQIRKYTPQIARQFNLIPSDIGRSIEVFTHNIRNFQLVDNLRAVIEDGHRIECEVSMRNGDQCLLRILPYLGESRRNGVVLTLQDLSEIKEAETRFRATFDNAAVGIAHVDESGRWIRVNARLCEILNYPREELLQLTFQQVTFEEDLNNDVDRFDALKSGKIDRYTVEKRYIRKDGDLVWISLTVSLQRNDDGQMLYGISIVQDISQRKRFERQLSGAIQQRDHFLATLSHELRNPLAAVRHSLALLRHNDAEVGVKDRALNTVERQVGQMAHLLDDLLDVSRITQEKIRYQMQPLDLRAVVEDAANAMRPSFAARDQELSVIIPDRPVPVLGDAVRLLQVVENLLTNACRYTPSGGSIEAELHTQPGFCRLTVSDTGTGIEPDLLEEVFSLFVQSNHNELNHRDSGMGLGLTLVRALVEHHGGNISAFSEGAGKGSRFTITLPQLATDRLPVEVQPSEKQKTASDDSPIRIVLVEDNDDARMMLQTLLSLEGFDVTTAADGLAGVEAISTVKPDIALVDIGLPELDGYGVARRIRELLTPEETYLIALTGYGQTKDIQQSEEAGFDHHMNKPVDPVELTEFLRTAQLR